jgi:hypothetical protein
MNIEDKVALACKALKVEVIDFNNLEVNMFNTSGIKCHFERGLQVEEIINARSFVNIRMDCFKGVESKRLLARVWDDTQEKVSANIRGIKSQAEKVLGDL